jgi:hypothetical protein
MIFSFLTFYFTLAPSTSNSLVQPELIAESPILENPCPNYCIDRLSGLDLSH